MKQITNKQRIIEAMQELPDDATVEQAMYKLYVLDEVSKALASTEEKVAHKDIKSQVRPLGAKRIFYRGCGS